MPRFDHCKCVRLDSLSANAVADYYGLGSIQPYTYYPIAFFRTVMPMMQFLHISYAPPWNQM